MNKASPLLSVAYFTMEVGLEPEIPTYSGGLGVLAGDTLRAAADRAIPLAGVSLLYRKGYFHQRLDHLGNQTEDAVVWSPEKYLEPLSTRVSVTIEGRTVVVAAWRYLVQGYTGFTVPVYLLDTALPENDAWDRSLTDQLYGGDQRYRLCQEAILGLGGEAMLRALGHNFEVFHMNEGHSALLVLGLLREHMVNGGPHTSAEAIRDAVRGHCVYTTHTPVPAGHDQFPLDLAQRVLGDDAVKVLQTWGCCLDGALNMTYLGLSFAHYINGVAMRHREISRDMFPNYPINSITNGVHASTWVSSPFQRLYDRHFPEWRRDNLYLRYAINLPPAEILAAHAEAKRLLLAEVERRTGVLLNPNAFTLGFARRATQYKRADLLFTDLDRLRRLARQAGPLQVLYAGKAHPHDEGGKRAICRVFEAAAALKDEISIVYLPEYDMDLARHLCGGADVWLNTPQKPQEASGTSGMKAALNGVPSLSILDGWWVEGCLEGVTGWAIGDGEEVPSESGRESSSLYDKLEYVVLPLFHSRPLAFAEVRRSAIALNGSFYNAQRMVHQYLHNAYLPPGSVASPPHVAPESGPLVSGPSH